MAGVGVRVGVWFVLVLLYAAPAHGTVINGLPTNETQYPHVVSYGACVGTLISDRWVLSAAHCYRPWNVRVGLLPQSSHSVRRAVTHPLYRLGANRANGVTTEIWATYDYLLLELVQPVTPARHLRLEDGPEPPAGTKALFPSFADRELLQGELYTLSDEECARRVQSFDPVTMLCAAGASPTHSGACYGDSGSGLVADGKLLGVLSWVEGDAVDCGADRAVVCARLSTPAIRDWIRNTMQSPDPPSVRHVPRKPQSNE